VARAVIEGAPVSTEYRIVRREKGATVRDRKNEFSEEERGNRATVVLYGSKKAGPERWSSVGEKKKNRRRGRKFKGRIARGKMSPLEVTSGCGEIVAQEKRHPILLEESQIISLTKSSEKYWERGG